ncbi:MAG: glycosyltransferase family 4 protein [Actinobacteria bacterium]|nr:MAG: glycosyltransferase family 4 protein [Actinomycetota bacterium]
MQPLAASERPSVTQSRSRPSEVTIVAHDVGVVGGMERILAELALGLKRRGHDVTVIAHSCDLPAGSGVRFRRVPGPTRPFVVSYPWFMIAGTVAVRLWRRGLVLEMGAIVLNRVDMIAVQYCQHAGPSTPSRASWPYRLNAKAAEVLGRLGERVMFARGRPARFICASEGIAEEIREHFPKQGDRAITIPNGVDLSAFAPGSRREEALALRASLKIQGGRRLAIFVGSEWERKGLEPVIRALGLAEAAAWDLLVVGDGDRERYERLAQEVGAAAAVHWLGVSRDVAPVYQLADAFVFPTSYEGFPLVALEAAASGVPILATPANGIRELVRDGVNGFLISRDPAVIAQRLRELGEDDALRGRLGSAARTSALDYSWEKMVERHRELYESLSSEVARGRNGSRGAAGGALP